MTRAIPRAAAVAGPVALLVLAACGARTPVLLGDDAPEEAGVDAPPMASLCAPTPSPGGVCNSLSPSGPLVTVECDRGMPPQPSGGTVVDGSYVMVSSRFFGPCQQDEERIVWNVCGNSWATAEEYTTSGTTSSKTITGTVQYGQGEVDFAALCPYSEPAVTFGYDATPDSLTLYIYGYGPGTVRVDEFARQ